MGTMKSFLKYLKHKFQSTERYKMTSAIRTFLQNESASYIDELDRKTMLKFLRYNLVDMYF